MAIGNGEIRTDAYRVEVVIPKSKDSGFYLKVHVPEILKAGFKREKSVERTQVRIEQVRGTNELVLEVPTGTPEWLIKGIFEKAQVGIRSIEKTRDYASTLEDRLAKQTSRLTMAERELSETQRRLTEQGSLHDFYARQKEQELRDLEDQVAKMDAEFKRQLTEQDSNFASMVKSKVAEASRAKEVRDRYEALKVEYNRLLIDYQSAMEAMRAAEKRLEETITKAQEAERVANNIKSTSPEALKKRETEISCLKQEIAKHTAEMELRDTEISQLKERLDFKDPDRVIKEYIRAYSKIIQEQTAYMDQLVEDGATGEQLDKLMAQGRMDEFAFIALNFSDIGLNIRTQEEIVQLLEETKQFAENSPAYKALEESAKLASEELKLKEEYENGKIPAAHLVVELIRKIDEDKNKETISKFERIKTAVSGGNLEKILADLKQRYADAVGLVKRVDSQRARNITIPYFLVASEDKDHYVLNIVLPVGTDTAGSYLANQLKELVLVPSYMERQDADLTKVVEDDFVTEFKITLPKSKFTPSEMEKYMVQVRDQILESQSDKDFFRLGIGVSVLYVGNWNLTNLVGTASAKPVPEEVVSKSPVAFNGPGSIEDILRGTKKWQHPDFRGLSLEQVVDITDKRAAEIGVTINHEHTWKDPMREAIRRVTYLTIASSDAPIQVGAIISEVQRHIPSAGVTKVRRIVRRLLFRGQVESSGTGKKRGYVTAGSRKAKVAKI